MGRPFFTHTTISDDSALGGSVIERSLRFNDNDSAYLNRTPASVGNKKKWTSSFWVKRANLGTQQKIFSAAASSTSYIFIQFTSADKIQLLGYGDNAIQLQLITSSLFRDTSAWYHIVVYLDSANSAVKLYVNGTEPPLSTNTQPTVNYNFHINNNKPHNIGRSAQNDSHYFDGYLTQFHHIDGQAYDPSYFGFTESQTGLWKPKRYTGSYGTNGFYLNFLDNSNTTAATLGKDSSGNGNNFTPNNFSVSAGEGNDSLEDTPTNNFCTLNSLDNGVTNTSHLVYRNGNLQVKGASGVWASTRGTFAVSSGKWYWEIKLLSVASMRPFIGVIQSDVRLASNQADQSNELGVAATSIAYWIGAPIVRGGANTSGTNTNVPSCTVGDIVGVALDMDNKKVYFSKNGTFFASQDPANNSGHLVAFSSTMQSSTIAPAIQAYNNTDEGAFNFGQRAFSYTPPTGFKTLCSANLPPTVPSITNPQKHFDTLLYTGNGSTRTISGLEFTPDFLWIKNRSSTFAHALFDSVRGPFKRLRSNQTNVEDTNDSDSVSGFVSGGFTTGADGAVNQNSSNIVAWCWKAGGAAVTNNDGSIASQVSANQEAGFSILTYTATNNVSETIGHGLGAKPAMIIVKSRNVAGQDWVIYNKNLDGGNQPATHILKFTDAAEADVNDVWQDTEPTSSVFTVGTEAMVNYTAGDTYVAYCWSEVPGFSKFGKYTGNGSTDGQYVHLGFRPAWVMVKRYDGAGQGWNIFDNKRNPFNLVDEFLIANSANAEATGSALNLDFLSNGFKFRGTDGGSNTSGSDYIYMAFAEQPGTTPYDTQTNAR